MYIIQYINQALNLNRDIPSITILLSPCREWRSQEEADIDDDDISDRFDVNRANQYDGQLDGLLSAAAGLGDDGDGDSGSKSRRSRRSPRGGRRRGGGYSRRRGRGNNKGPLLAALALGALALGGLALGSAALSGTTATGAFGTVTTGATLTAAGK